MVQSSELIESKKITVFLCKELVTDNTSFVQIKNNVFSSMDLDQYRFHEFFFSKTNATNKTMNVKVACTLCGDMAFSPHSVFQRVLQSIGNFIFLCVVKVNFFGSYSHRSTENQKKNNKIFSMIHAFRIVVSKDNELTNWLLEVKLPSLLCNHSKLYHELLSADPIQLVPHSDKFCPEFSQTEAHPYKTPQFQRRSIRLLCR